MKPKALPRCEGDGHIRFLGATGPARYSIEGDPRRLRLGSPALRGSITLTPDLADDAFRAGDGVLTLDSGEELRVTMRGHSSGGSEVFIEVRV